MAGRTYQAADGLGAFFGAREESEHLKFACISKKVVQIATSIHRYPGNPEDCCMKYINCPAKPPGGGEMLPFLQQFEIAAHLMREML
ncbi:hypothetical protein [Paenibacillus sp. FSL R10-2771]|uniref:hypothetical protein n=1 Tax=Paenibacillus sp. FSL R10-2771 TaxID=2954693 RepID=UPI0004F61394|nr:hypothetical protein P40081_06685 [Paenibacillus sp. FSL P4-0081]